MNKARAQIISALDMLIENKNGIVFQRLACQLLKSRWPSLGSVAEQNDLGEDAVTIISETSDHVIRSLACSLTATINKVSSDAEKVRVSKQGSRVEELIFATPKTVTRKIQKRWKDTIKIKFSLNLILIERSEFLALLERPENQWLCKNYLSLSLGYLYLLDEATSLVKQGITENALTKAEKAEQEALNNTDWDSVCRARLLIAEITGMKEGQSQGYQNKAKEALDIAKDHNLYSLRAECLTRYANSLMLEDPDKARNLLGEAESNVGDNIRMLQGIYKNQAQLEIEQENIEAAERALCKLENLVEDKHQIGNSIGYYYIKFRLAAKQGHSSKALDQLNEGLKIARAKKMWRDIGDILYDKARFIAHTGDLAKAKSEASKARKAFEKANFEHGTFLSALLEGHLHFDIGNPKRAGELCDFVLSRIKLDQFEDHCLDALQLKTKALQIMGDIEGARECNGKFRSLVGHEPRALLLSDIQEAMLLAQSGAFSQAEAIIKEAIIQAKKAHVQEEMIALWKINWASIKLDQAHYHEAIALIEEALKCAYKWPPKIKEEAEHMLMIARDREPSMSIIEELFSNPSPLKLAKTDKAKTIHEAHQEIIHPLLNWTKTWPQALEGIYDFWGRGNFTRFMLNHRGFPNSYHVTVEVTNVNEARQWTRILCPLVDVLTILWKGPVSGESMCIVPVGHDYGNAGGWGYSITGGRNMRPSKTSEDWNWSPAMGFANLLPSEALSFIFNEARALFESGRLFLFPGAHVGCIDPNHGPMERILNEITHAIPILSCRGGNDNAITLKSIPMPYFPDIPLNELARIIEGEEESLLAMRIALHEWARNLATPDKYEASSVMRECYDKINDALRRVKRQFEQLSTKLEYNKQDGKLHSYSIDADKFEVNPMNSVSAELTALHGELRASPWYAFFRMSSMGYRWDLHQKNASTSVQPSNHPNPAVVHHWIVPPKSGWRIPTVKSFDI